MGSIGRVLPVSALVLAGMQTAGALAQETAPDNAPQATDSYIEDGRQVFLPGYFSRFAPQTARDMLNNVPGFQIREGDDRRGFGQGGINVLINGARVSGKSTNPLTLLGQTSAESVIRIEIVEGATLGISGLSGEVANVVIDQDQTTGNWEYKPQFRKGLTSRLLFGSVSMSGKVGDVSYTWGLENESFRNGAWGDEFVYDGAGRITERRYEVVEPKGENPEASLSLTHKNAAGREANLNAKAALYYFDNSRRSEQTPLIPPGPDRLRVTIEGEDEWNAEIGADYALDALGGRLKLIGFNYFERSDYDQEVTLTNADGFLAGDRYRQLVVEGESILRGEQSWPFGKDRQVEIAAELAYNYVDNQASLFELNADGSDTEIELFGADSKVEERRGEVSATYNFPLGDKLSLQASAAVEYSELEQSGDLVRTRSFVRPKGFVSATYHVTPKLEWRGRVDRRVGQLEFGAFTSSVNLDAENGQVGNTDLKPEQSWYVESALERTFDDKSQVTLQVSYERFEDVVQQIPIGDGDGPGNVPEATRWRGELSGTQMLETFGVPGGEVNYEFVLRESDIEDPFTGLSRRLNEETKWFYRLEYRHDIPDTPYAYGASIEDFELSPYYRRSQVTLYDQSKPTVEIYAEHKDIFGATGQIYAYNILNYTEDFQRDAFEGTRPAPLRFREANAFAFDVIFGINLSGTF